MNFTYTTTDLLPRSSIKQEPPIRDDPVVYPISEAHIRDLARHNPEDAAVLLRKIRQPQIREQPLDSMEDRR